MLMSGQNLTVVWLRRDLRLVDHPAFVAAAERGAVIPVFIHDDSVANLGAAPKWRLAQALRVFSKTLEDAGSRLILRRGPAQEVLDELIEETGADAVYWSRLYDPEAIERDSRIKSTLKDRDIDAQSFHGHLIFEPWDVETKQGGMYQVYSPMWRAVKDREVDEPLSAPDLTAPGSWPDSDALDDRQMETAMRRGADVVAQHCKPGQDAASAALAAFSAHRMEDYKDRRDFPGEEATSGLSEYLTVGEISPRQLWHAALRGEADGKKGAEHFRKEVVWREFAYHLLYHTPRLVDENWREGWDDFGWTEDERLKEVKAWKQARTGIRFVDAALREMYVTGRMHNRARMVVASYLTKHCLVHWRVGQKWFEDCLTDWDIASNSMGWQWVAGCGPDAAPYFRVFNPDTQLEKFDPDGEYVRAWIAEGQSNPTKTALSYFDAIPESWGLSPDDPYPDPVVGLSEGREAALAAYDKLKSDQE